MKRESTREEKELLIQRISEILEGKKHVTFAYVFGSFSVQESFNDIDIGIYVSDTIQKSALNTELEIEKELENLIHVTVDVRILNKAPISFVYHVIRTGTVIVDKNRDLKADFEGLIYKKYFDFQHLRNEYLREVINAPI